MKIIIINGSNRKKGATALVLNEFYQLLKKRDDIDVQYIDVFDLHLNYCSGCGKCYKKGKCIFEDDIEKLSLEISQANGIILGSPTYASNVSAQMKTIIDRGHFVIEQLLYGKYAISVSTYENYGGKETSRILNRLLTYSGAKISKSFLIKIPFSSNPLENSSIKNEINHAANRFYTDIAYQKKYFFQSIKHFLIFRFGIVPFVRKKGIEYEGVLKHWSDRKIKIKGGLS